MRIIYTYLYKGLKHYFKDTNFFIFSGGTTILIHTPVHLKKMEKKKGFMAKLMKILPCLTGVLSCTFLSKKKINPGGEDQLAEDCFSNERTRARGDSETLRVSLETFASRRYSSSKNWVWGR